MTKSSTCELTLDQRIVCLWHTRRPHMRPQDHVITTTIFMGSPTSERSTHNILPRLRRKDHIDARNIFKKFAYIRWQSSAYVLTLDQRTIWFWTIFPGPHPHSTSLYIVNAHHRDTFDKQVHKKRSAGTCNIHRITNNNNQNLTLTSRRSGLG